jgi:hypothetical protein
VGNPEKERGAFLIILLDVTLIYQLTARWDE